MGNTSVIESLIDFGADINIQDNCGNTPLHIAVRYKYLDIVQILLKFQPNTELKNLDGDTPLMLATKNKNNIIFDSINSYKNYMDLSQDPNIINHFHNLKKIKL